MNGTMNVVQHQIILSTIRAQRAERAASSAELAGSPSNFDSVVSAKGAAPFEMAACHRAGSAQAALVQPSAPRLIAEWQQRGPETLSGRALPKLRLTLCADTVRHNVMEDRR